MKIQIISSFTKRKKGFKDFKNKRGFVEIKQEFRFYLFTA